MSGSYTSLKVADLRTELQKRGLNTSGTKSEMIEKLKADDASKAAAAAAEAASEPAPEPTPAAAAEPAKAEVPKAAEPVVAEPAKAEVPVEKKVSEKVAKDSSSAAPATSAPSTATSEPPKPAEPTLEQLKEQVLSELQTRLKRISRFGTNAEQEKEIQASITRINKLGLSSKAQAYKILGTYTGGNQKRNHSSTNNNRNGNNRVSKSGTVRR